IKDIVESYTTWKNIKATILKLAKVKYDIKIKIEYLMNLKLNENESVEKINQQYPETYKEAKD
ncbi:34067_t:CDS:2, partial [Racocetra persica]